MSSACTAAGAGSSTSSTAPKLPPSFGALLVRPDGHIGFRAPPADAAGLAALDTFLDSYLVPVGAP